MISQKLTMSQPKARTPTGLRRHVGSKVAPHGALVKTERVWLRHRFLLVVPRVFVTVFSVLLHLYGRRLLAPVPGAPGTLQLYPRHAPRTNLKSKNPANTGRCRRTPAARMGNLDLMTRDLDSVAPIASIKPQAHRHPQLTPIHPLFLGSNHSIPRF